MYIPLSILKLWAAGKLLTKSLVVLSGLAFKLCVARPESSFAEGVTISSRLRQNPSEFPPEHPFQDGSPCPSILTRSKISQIGLINVY